MIIWWLEGPQKMLCWNCLHLLTFKWTIKCGEKIKRKWTFNVSLWTYCFLWKRIHIPYHNKFPNSLYQANMFVEHMELMEICRFFSDSAISAFCLLVCFIILCWNLLLITSKRWKIRMMLVCRGEGKGCDYDDWSRYLASDAMLWGAVLVDTVLCNIAHNCH